MISLDAVGSVLGTVAIPAFIILCIIGGIIINDKQRGERKLSANVAICVMLLCPFALIVISEIGNSTDSFFLLALCWVILGLSFSMLIVLLILRKWGLSMIGLGLFLISAICWFVSGMVIYNDWM